MKFAEPDRGDPNVAYELHIERPGRRIEREEWRAAVRALAGVRLSPGDVVAVNPRAQAEVRVAGGGADVEVLFVRAEGIRVREEWIRVFRFSRGHASFRPGGTDSATDPVRKPASALGRALGADIVGGEGSGTSAKRKFFSCLARFTTSRSGNLVGHAFCGSAGFLAGWRWVVMGGRRSQKREAEIAVFIRQYARKRYPGMDPNDRRYDREIEKMIRQMKPEELDRLLRGEADEDLTEAHTSQVSWPFDQPENSAALTTRAVIEAEQPIRVVLHYGDDHSWAFLCGTTSEEGDARVVSMREASELDPTVLDVADLDPGWQANRDGLGAPWRRSRISGDSPSGSTS